MSIAGVDAAAASQTTAAPTAAAKASKNDMNYDSFLKLLVAQMKNQDPMNPSNSTEYVAQLATFANVEQSIQTNTRLDSMMTVSALTQADALIGRTLTSLDGETQGTVTSIRAVNGGIQATLEGGKTIVLGDGVSVA
ncbi:flagellar hook assembly protein FlgD [Fulvimarina sp. 2208YS6-2-32]|uniref:Basal-body rod modification protein FlgD n=1 Tax=Fulvimarina uroteuthidis TaxID=3098149 RepID=A0ABU5HZX2_9HYPH|nr:flagellar hook assembly protein FlgD [Fulvimarina sp. 2208YS6-2-32]MDY8108083.1 flagellar hook assembly protein FlgD [Fulvimarina sp. 2208YS6-2-32]